MYLKDTNIRLAKQYSNRADKNAFKYGFAIGVQAKVQEILRERSDLKMQDGKSLVVVKKALVEQKFGKQQKQRCNFAGSGSMYARDDGVRAGMKQNFNRPVANNSNVARLK